MHFGQVARAKILARSVSAGVRFVADLLPVSPRVCAQRMRVHRRTVDAAVGDVVDELAFFRVELCEMTDALGDFVIGARGVAADAEAADARLAFVERDAAAERDRSAADLAVCLAGVLWRLKTRRIEWIRLGDAPQRMSG